MMDLRAILFDVNGTLVDIETDEGQDRIYRVISRFLTYEAVQIAPPPVIEREPEPIVSASAMVLVVIFIVQALTLATIEVLFRSTVYEW